MNNIPEELPKIRQTLFIVDRSRKYLFDVNQNILIKHLKKMIASASGLNKVSLRLFHEGKEYTQYDESALDELFPNLDLVEFDIQYSYEQVEDLEEIINLKLKNCCPFHGGKYPYFYCFTCVKSICSDCLFSGEHKGHEIKEKYDYLQESKNLVELLFKDLKDIFKNTKEGSTGAVNDLKNKVNVQFFPKLVEMVKQIEQKMMNLILYFLEKEKGNYNTIENNVKLLKSHCQEGLDKLKKEIVIEDIMVDENVFLTFDSKFKEIGNEKEKFKDDIQKYKQFSDNLFLIQSIIEKTYKEIYDFLNKYLTVAEFEDIKNKLNSQDISVIDKKIIFDKLLSNIKRKNLNDINDIKNQNQEININDNINNNINDGYHLRKRNEIPPPIKKELLFEDKINPIKKEKNINLFGNITKKQKHSDIKEEKDNNMQIDNQDENENEEKENYIEINTDNKFDKYDNDNNKEIKDKKNGSKKKISIRSGYTHDNNKDYDNNNIYPDNTINMNSNMNTNTNILSSSKEPLKKTNLEINDSNYINRDNIDYEMNNINNNNINIDNNNRNDSHINIDTHIMNLRSGNQKISYGYSITNNNSNNRSQNNQYNGSLPVEKESKSSTHINNTSKNNTNISYNNNINNTYAQKNINKTEESEEEDFIYEGQIYNIVCNIVPPKNQVVLYDVDKDAIIRKEVTFSPLLGLSHFLAECAWVNNNNKLYILGGVDDFNKSSKIFLEFDPIKEKIKRLPDSKYTHSRHSLFAYDNQIFVIGGDRLECEKYDINKNEWSSLPNLSFKQIYPVLYVHNDIMYSFFGIDENIRKTDCVQKLNLKNNKAKWQKVVYKKNKCNLCVFGCGIAKINENCVLFLGGMDDNGIRDEAIQFDFNNLSAKKTEFLLEEKAYFKDSVLLRLSPNDFGNFSIEETNPFLKIKFQFNVKKMTN